MLLLLLLCDVVAQLVAWEALLTFQNSECGPPLQSQCEREIIASFYWTRIYRGCKIVVVKILVYLEYRESE